MNCNNCNNKASITFNNIDYCISCFMSSDSQQLASQEIQKEIKKEIPGKRVGVVLPPGVAGVLSNVALLLADKSPVNLNFTFGSKNLRYAMKKSGVDAVLSASLMQEKFPQFPWPPNVLDIGDWLREKSRKKAELAWETLLVLVLPMRLRPKPRKEFEGKDSEGALLFTSGSSGNPKGVVLSHGNLLANCDQIAGLEIFSSTDKILANLPLFHSFGFTVATILPLMNRSWHWQATFWNGERTIPAMVTSLATNRRMQHTLFRIFLFLWPSPPW